MNTTSKALFPVIIICTIAASVTMPAGSTTETLANNNKRYKRNNSNNTACKHPENMWGDLNPSIFYMCDAVSQVPIRMYCPQGRGFFNGLGYYGCIPYEEWPACITNANATEESFICDAHHMRRPWATLDPHKFYVCAELNAPALLLNCAEGRGFVHANAVGCATWSVWRKQTQCETFY